MTDVAAESDSERVERAQAGDRYAFAEILARHRDPVRAFLYRLGVTDRDLDDATQEVFLKVVADLSRFERRSTFRTWVFGIALNVSRGLRAARSRVTETIGDDTLGPTEPPDASSLAAELGDRLRASLTRLPSAEREAFVLRHVEEFSVEATAAVLGLPEGTIKRLVHQARQKLMGWLVDCEVRR